MGQVLQFFGVKIQKETIIVGFKSSDSSKYVHDGKFSESALKDFAAKFEADKLEKALKSQDVPAKEVDEDGITVVVGKTFDKIVKDPKKDVLLEIYAPWCGHCKALAPTLSKLAKSFKSTKSVVIAKMDGTENEVSDLAIQGYPSLFFFGAEKEASKIAFEGADRSLETFQKFIKDNAKVAIKENLVNDEL